MALVNAHQRKVLTSVTLGCWLFALFVGVAHACGLDAALSPLHHAVTVSVGSQDQGDEDALLGCEQFCADDLPVVAKLQLVQDHPGGHALPLPSLGEPLIIRVAWAPSLARRLDPPPDIAPNIRFVRLAL